MQSASCDLSSTTFVDETLLMGVLESNDGKGETKTH